MPYDTVSLWRPAIAKFLDREKHSMTIFEFTVDKLSLPQPTQRRRRPERLRFDAVGLNPFRVATTSPIRILETKSSRQDFLKDQKWMQYLDYATQFAFLCSPGVILSSELPKGVGLFYIEAGNITKQAEWSVRQPSQEHRAAVAHRLHSKAVGQMYDRSKRELVTFTEKEMK